MDLAGSGDFLFFNVALMSADTWGFKEMMKNQTKKKCFIKVEF